MTEKRATETTTAPHFTKAQLMGSHKYASKRDLIGALLNDKETYTTEQVDALIEKYLKGKVV